MAAELTITEGENNSVVLAGEIDTHTSPLLEDRLLALADSSSVTLDLTAVTFISSAGLTAMLATRSRLQAAGGSLSVQNPTPAVERMFTLSGLSDLLAG